MKSRVKEFTNIYERLLRVVQTPVCAQLFHSPSASTLLVDYSTKTLENLAIRRAFTRLYTIPLADKLQVLEAFPSSFESAGDLKVRSISPSGRAEIKIKKVKQENKELLLLELWKEGSLAKTKDLTKTLKLVYNDHMFGSLAWSHDEQTVAFIAEPADKLFPGIWEEEQKEGLDPLSKYDFKEDFGEQLPDKCQPTLYVFNLRTETLDEVQAANGKEEFSPARPLFSKEGGLVFQGYGKTIPRYGLIYCFNRPCALYYIKDYHDKSSVAERLTNEYLAMAPSFSPDGSRLAYFAVEKEFIEHCCCIELRYLDWPKSAAPHVVVPTVYAPKENEFPGIYGMHNQFTDRSCGFLEDSRHFVFNSLERAHEYVYVVDVTTGQLRRLSNEAYPAEEQSIMAIQDNLLILRQSSANEALHFLAVKLDMASGKDPVSAAQWAKFGTVGFNEKAGPVDSLLHSTISKVVKSRVVAKNGEGYLYYSAATSGKRGLVVLIHGGPHSMFVGGFLNTVTMYLAAGYAVLGVNYRGSIGYGQNYVKSLLGHIGDYDVADCIECIQAACEQHKDIVDPENLFVSGGSHGGFLTLWLIARQPDMFRAALARNPVADVTTMGSISDIPEWGAAEALHRGFFWPPHEDELKEFFRKSPVSEVGKVKTPLMLFLGRKDRRVPMAGCMPYYNALRAAGKPVKLLHFPEDCHPLEEPETEVQVLLNGLAWIDEHAKKSA